MKAWEFHRVSEAIAFARGEALAVLEELRGTPFASFTTDPPSGTGFMGKSWDTFAAADAFVAEMRPIFEQALRLLEPGAHGAVWALPRTSHWTGWALERAGFEIRDSIHHVQGQGFTKSLNVSKALDKAAGVAPIGEEPASLGMAKNPQWNALKKRIIMPAPTTRAAKQWRGWHTALAPRHEVWWLVRKPFKGSVGRNVLARGTGAINVGACLAAGGRHPANFVFTHSPECSPGEECVEWCPVRLLDVQAGPRSSHGNPDGYVRRAGSLGYKKDSKRTSIQKAYYEVGGASRFFPVFFCPKAPAREKNAGLDGLPKKTAAEITGRKPGSAGLVMKGGKANPFAGPSGKELRANHHPTPKPLGFCRWLVRLVTPPGGVVLDSFAGSASIGVASALEGFGYFGIERDRDGEGRPLGYLEIALGRLRHAAAGGEF